MEVRWCNVFLYKTGFSNGYCTHTHTHTHTHTCAHLLDRDNSPGRDLVQTYEDPVLEEDINHHGHNAYKDDHAFFVCLKPIVPQHLQTHTMTQPSCVCICACVCACVRMMTCVCACACVCVCVCESLAHEGKKQARSLSMIKNGNILLTSSMSPVQPSSEWYPSKVSAMRMIMTALAMSLHTQRKMSYHSQANLLAVSVTTTAFTVLLQARTHTHIIDTHSF